MSIRIEEIPQYAADASRRLLHDVLDVMGDDLVAAWLYGGATFADRPLQRGDVDLCFVFGDLEPDERRPAKWRDDPASRPARVTAAGDALAGELGLSLDTTYLLEDELRGDLPADAFWEARRNTGWAVMRGHWLAGQYVHLYGRVPEDLVVAPTPDEMARALDREVEHLERHVYQGDAADPYEATYAVWNGCRVLHTVETGSPVISKRSAGAWGLEHLAVRWHDAIRAAGRNYDGRPRDGDVELLRDTMVPFVAMVRERVPVTEPRPPGPPRWSIDVRE